jgi:hypothetical protein
MKRTIILTSVLVICVLIQNQILAQRVFNEKKNICIVDIDALLQPIFPPHIVGCEAIDCCRGCPGGFPIDFTTYGCEVQIEGEGVLGVNLKDLSGSDLPKSFKYTNSRFQNGMIKMGKTSSVNDIRLSNNQSLLFSPKIVYDTKFLRDFQKNSSKKSINSKVSITYYLGKNVIKKYYYGFEFENCGSSELQPIKDKLRIVNNINNVSSLILMDFNKSIPTLCVEDDVFTTINNETSFDNIYSSGVCHSEIIAFTENKAVSLLENPAWTNSSDIISIDLRDSYVIPISIWILSGDYETNRLRAELDVLRANEVYNRSRGGIQFQATYHNATTDADSAKYKRTWCCERLQLINDIGFDNARLNVYYADNVLSNFDQVGDCGGKDSASVANGWTCGGAASMTQGNNILLISISNSNPETLSHEIGHTLNVNHVFNRHTGEFIDVTGDGIPDFDRTNIMAPGRHGRTHFTEGQMYRAVFHPNSLLNIYGIRSGATRNCSQTDRTGQCLPLEFNRD